MSQLDEVGERDGWRCWLCDGPVDPHMSVNDPRGPSIDSRITKSRAKAKSKTRGGGPIPERLAHRACNTGKGNLDAVVPWSEDLFVIDPAPIIPAVERLGRKGGREAMARCPSQADAEEAAAWLIDRLSRLEPGLQIESQIDEGGGQFVISLRA